jgi:alkylation response protein AidB-like acyl-CoA dehydrogenase
MFDGLREELGPGVEVMQERTTRHDRAVGDVGGWVIIAAGALGQARRAFDDTLVYVKDRQQFGKPIGSFQALSQRIADLATEIEATRLLVHDVAQRVDENPDTLLPREASMVKLKATELAKHAAPHRRRHQ